MTFDKQDHKDALIALFNQATFPGSMTEMVFELKRALMDGKVVEASDADKTHDQL